MISTVLIAGAILAGVLRDGFPRAVKYLVFAAFLSTALPSSAQTTGIFWTTDDLNTISRANLDGTAVDRNYTSGMFQALAITVDSEFLYWTDIGGNPIEMWPPSINRDSHDGTVHQDLWIPTGPDPGASGVAVDETYIYWTNVTDNSIGRANLDGTGRNETFIDLGASGHFIRGLAVDETFIYWTNESAGTIGRVTLDGTNVDPNFITGALGPFAVAVDKKHVYWTSTPIGSGMIGRANLDGTGVAQDFITGADIPLGVAVSPKHIYWTNDGSNSIGRANLNGTGVDQSFIANASPASRPYPVGIAVLPAPISVPALPPIGLLVAIVAIAALGTVAAGRRDRTSWGSF